MNIRKIRRVFAISMVCIMLCSVISPDRLIEGAYMNMVDAEGAEESSSPKEEYVEVNIDVSDNVADTEDSEESDSSAKVNVPNEQGDLQNENSSADTDNESNADTDSEVRNDSQYIDNENASDVQNSLEKDSKDDNNAGIEQDSDIKQNDNIETSDNLNDATDKTNSKKNKKLSDADEITEDNIDSKLAGSEDAVGNLIVSNFKVWHKGDPLMDGMTVTEDDDLSLAFDWRINNNENEITKFATKLSTVNISITELTGPLYYEGEQIATYSIDKAADRFNVELDLEAVEGMSNIGGGAILAGKVHVGENRSEPDGSEQPLGFGTYVKNVNYSNPGSVSFKKQGPKNSSDSDFYEESGKLYINYSITLDYREIMKGITVTDTVDVNTELDVSSLKITSTAEDGTVTDVTAALAVKTDVTTAGFTFTPDDSPGKAQEMKYTISYRVSLKDGTEFTDVAEIKNNAKLTYTDEHGEPAGTSGEVTTTVKKPSITKTGAILTDEDGNPVSKRNLEYDSKPVYCYPVQYTLTVTPNDFKKLFEDNTSAAIKLVDTLSGKCDAISDTDWMFFESDGANYTSLAVAGKNNTIGGFFSPSLTKLYGGTVNSASNLYLDGEAMTNDELLQQLVNAQHIFGVNGIGETPTKKDYEIKISDFTKNDTTGNYEYKYMIFVPSYEKYTDVFTNNIEATVFGVEFKGETKTRLDVPPSAILVKGPSNVATSSKYTADNTSSYGADQKQYVYIDELAEGETRSYVDYSVALRMDTFRYTLTRNGDGEITGRTPMGSDWETAVSGIKHIKMVDRLNGYTARRYGNPDDPYNISSSGTTSGKISLNALGIRDVKLELYSLPYTQQFDRSALNAAEEAFLSYGETYGWLNDTEHAEGYDQVTLLALWNTYKAAWDAYNIDNSSYIGSITWDDLDSISGCSVSYSNGELVVDIDTASLNKLSFKRYYYNPTGELYSSGGSSPISSIKALVAGNGDNVYHLVLRYRVDTTDVITESATLYNTASVYFDDDTDTTDDTYPPVYVNSVVNVKEKNNVPATDYIAFKKDKGTLKFSDQTFSYKEGRYLGWSVRVDLRYAIAGDGKEVVITDELPDGLTFDGTDNGDCIAYVASGMSVTNKTYAQCMLPDNYYKIDASGKQLKITFDYTDELEDLLKTTYNSRYINFYFRTMVDDSVIVDLLESKKTSKSFENRAVAAYGDIQYKSDYVTDSFTLEKQISKDSMDKDYQTVTGEPVVDVKNSTVSGYYRIEVNPYSVDLVDGDLLTVTDVMTDKMTIDPTSVRAVAVDTGSDIAIEQSVQTDNTVKFTVPDKTHLYIYYKVIFNVNPGREPNWMKKENTQNSCTISAYESTKNTDDEVDFSGFTSNISVWSYQMTGDISVFKYWNNGGNQEALPGATFKVYSVYDNNGNTYPDLSKDDVYQRYKDGLVSTADGTCDFKRLPLDRIYKLVETAAPDDVSLDADNEYYFILEGNFGVEIPDFLKDKDVKVFHTGNIISYENKKVVAVSGSKTWKDENDKDGLRPVSITVHLLADGNEIDKRTVTAKDNWKWDFGKLPRNKEDGTEIVYSVKEDVVTGYETEYNGLDIVNTHKAKEETTTEATTEVTTETATEAKTETATEKKKKTATEEKTTETSKKTGSSSKTGDASETGAAAGALVISVIGLFVLMYRRNEL
ncbi:MAG: Cna B-type domain-containing protein [Lachnospiraceae bacterium]|nr:Cna B-type domain-containing protein [Lachnospiraceae bacterium]